MRKGRGKGVKSTATGRLLGTMGWVMLGGDFERVAGSEVILRGLELA